MTRKLRIEYEGAVYHVINRGNYRADIFEQSGARAAFLKCLDEACQKSGWIVHAWVIMRNHYHLALETPRGNLVPGMQWLQATFAARFNRFRKESGHIFQGRYKAILIEPDRSLGSLCQYIHLNPVRAKIVPASELARWPWSSCSWITQPNERLSWFSPKEVLSHAGGCKDTPLGRRDYVEFLERLSAEPQEQKNCGFDQMSKGWAVGSIDFKNALIDEHKSKLMEISLGGNETIEARELFWEQQLQKVLSWISPTKQRDSAKSADWRVATAAIMKKHTTASNPWLAKRLEMGSPFTVSRLVSECWQGTRAAREYKRLTAKSKV